jgi:hypothetical protein
MGQRQVNMLVFVTIGMFGVPQTGLTVENRQPVTMSASRFGEMSTENQKALLGRVFERRLEHARNIHYEVDIYCSHYANRNGELGDPMPKIAPRRFQYQQWQLGDSYRHSTNKYRSPDFEELHVWMSSGFDGDQGVARSAIRVKGKEEAYGRIDTKEDPAIYDNQYRYWLDGTYPHWQEFLFRYLVGRKDEFEIEVPIEGDFVLLTVPYQPAWAKEPGGKRVFHLDPKKGLLPVKGDSRWHGPSGSGKPTWRIEKFEIEDSQLVGDVWMPIKMRFSISASSAPVPNFSVYDMAVTKIEYGAVTDADLMLPFTEGMKVVDAIEGVTYRAGADGSPQGTVERVYRGGVPVSGSDMAAMTGDSVSTRSPWIRRLALFASIGLVMVFLVVALARRRSSGQT